MSHQGSEGNPDQHVLHESGRNTSYVLEKGHESTPVTEANVFASGSELPKANMMIRKSDFQNFVNTISSCFTSMQKSINNLQHGEGRRRVEENLDV